MIDLSNFKQLTIDGKKIVQLFIDDILVWRAYKNWVRYSINADGSIYNDGIGYKDGYRVRSGGTEGSTGHASCTGFIKVNPGDVIRIAGWPFEGSGSGNSINASDSGFTNIGQASSNGNYGIFSDEYSAYNYPNSVVKEHENMYRWIVPPAASGVAYIRISGYDVENGPPGSKMIVTVNEEII